MAATAARPRRARARPRAATRSRRPRPGSGAPGGRRAARTPSALRRNPRPRAAAKPTRSWPAVRAARARRAAAAARSTPRSPRATRRGAARRIARRRAAPGSPSSRPSRSRRANSGCTGRCRRRTSPPGCSAPRERLERAEQLGQRRRRLSRSPGRGARRSSKTTRRCSRPSSATGRRSAPSAAVTLPSWRRPPPTPRRRCSVAEPRSRARSASLHERAATRSSRSTEEHHRLESELSEAGASGAAIVERVETEWKRPFDAARRGGVRCSNSISTRWRARPTGSPRPSRASAPVNPLAVEEHAEESKRLEFLPAQRDDLVAARQSLQQAIREIDGTARGAVPRDVRGGARQLPNVFQTLFGGGECDLRLAIRSRPARLRHRDPRGAARQADAADPPALERGADAGGAVAALRHLPHQAEPVLPAGRGGRAARRRERRPVHCGCSTSSSTAPSSS